MVACELPKLDARVRFPPPAYPMKRLILLFFCLGELLKAEPTRYYHPVPLPEHPGAFIPAFVSAPAGESPGNIRNTLIVFHGRGYESSYTYDTVYKKLSSLGLEKEIFLMAPQFFSKEKGIENPWIPGLLVWTNDWWRYGSAASGFMGSDSRLVQADVSSFRVVDKIIADLEKQNSGTIQNLVLFGFSAGGQFVQRYSLYGAGNESSGSGVKITYIVSSPASYMYVNANRPGNDKPFSASMKKNGNSSIEEIDEFPYGMSNIDGLDSQGRTICRYFFDTKANRRQVLERFPQREVYYFVGAKDLRQSGFDATPPAMAQGSSRVERAKNFYRNLQEIYGESLKHKLHIIEDADHNLEKIVESEAWGQLISGLQKPGSKTP